MGFQSLPFLIGLAGAALPVLIHLLTRDRVVRVQFSTLRFFVKGSKRVLRRKRLREMLLLLMRAAACALLALAFARPYIKDDDQGMRLRKARVVVVDNSGSMNWPGKPEFVADEVAKVIDDLSGGADGAALIVFSDVPIVREALTRSVSKVPDAIKGLEKPRGATQIVPGLIRADELLRDIVCPDKKVVLISDLQRPDRPGAESALTVGAGADLNDLKLYSGAELVIRQVWPGGEKPNIAVVGADVPASATVGGGAREIRPHLRLFAPMKDGKSAQAAPMDVEVTLKVTDGGASEEKVVETKTVQVLPDQPVRVQFRYDFPVEGDARGIIEVKADDAVADDNVFRFVTRVEARRVVVLTPHPATGDASDGAFYVLKALMPDPSAPGYNLSRVLTTDERPEAVAEAVRLIGQASVAVMVDVAKVSAPVRQAMVALTERGGGLIHLPGELGPEGGRQFNECFAGLAPAMLERVTSPRGPDGQGGEVTFGDVVFDHRIWSVWRDPRLVNVAVPRFWKYWEVSGSQLSRVLARFEDGRPALMESAAGRGSALLLVSPPDTDWNNLGRSETFVPLLNQAVSYQAGQAGTRTTYRVGDRIRAPDGYVLTDPKGKEHGGGTTAEVAHAGFCRLRSTDGGEQMWYAVNPDMSEAYTDCEDAEKLVAWFRTWQMNGKAERMQADLGRKEEKDDKNRLWWYVLTALALLVCGELLLANRTQRH